MKSKATQFIARSTRRSTFICSAAVLAALSGRNQAWADPGMTNLALDAAAGGTATATATNSDFGTTPNLGIDGNRDGNFSDGSVFYENSPNNDGTDTNPNTPYSYQVDLGQNDYIDRVQFLPRTDVDQNVFGNFNISIYPDNGSGQPAATPSFSQNYNTSYFGDSFATLDPGAAVPGGANGRFVRITRLDNNYWMTFAEMEVIGAPTPLQYTVSNDIALGKPVTTSSAPGFGALITGGNDGDINGDFNAPDRPVYHSSNHSVGEYWQVDLGADTPLSYAELFARTVINTTSQFDVEVFNSSMSLVDSVIVNNSDPQGTTPGYDHTIDLTGVTGEFIRVATTTDSYLSFSELEVFEALTWNNTGGTGDGVTWDVGTNQNWNDGSPATYAAGSGVTFNDTNNGHYNVTLNSTVSPSSVTFNNSAGNYVISGTGGIAGTGSLSKSGTDTVTLSTVNTYSGGTTVSAGTLVIAAAGAFPANSSVSITGGTLQLATGTGGETLSSLSITAGILDIGNNHFILSYAAGTQAATDASIRGYLISGRNGGTWTGTTGITSSTAALPANSHYAIGYADGADGVVAGLSSGQIEVKYTLLGDADLDGVVTGSDFTALVGNLGKSGRVWDQGDFEYTGSVTGSDFTDLVSNLGKSAAGADVVLPAADYAAIDAFAAANGLMADVPEPATAGLLTLGAIVLARRRRKQTGRDSGQVYLKGIL